MTVRIDHIALIVRDSARSAELFRALFDAAVIPPSAARRGPPETLVRLDGATLVLIEGEPPAARTDAHVAFAVAADALPMYAQRLAALGVEHQMSRAGPAARSLYFADFDHHLFELHAPPDA